MSLKYEKKGLVACADCVYKFKINNNKTNNNQ